MYQNHFKALAAAALVLLLSTGVSGQQRARLEAVQTQVPEIVGRSFDLGHSDPDRTLHLAVSLPYGNPGAIEAYVDSISDPASPNYLNFLTPEEVGERFGLADNDVQSVVDFLKAAGFQITLVGKNRLSILAEGTVAQAESAFNTSIHEFQAIRADEPGNPRYFSFTSELKLPVAIAPFVIDVTGLENFTKPQLRALTPTQTRTLYDLAPMYSTGTQGQGRTVAISNWDGYRLSNVPLYYAQYGLPAPAGGAGSNISVVTVSGGAGGGTPQGEGDLDIQMVLGMAPLCSLRIYDGGGSDLIGVLTAEANDNLADVITESYGWNISASTAVSAHNLHLSMSAQGITYMAASGDSGTTLEPYSYPDYDPEVLMVGGTIATVNGSGVRSSEVAWSLSGGQGGGSGWSTNTASFNVLPSWQRGTNVPTTINHRLVPDVALNAGGPGAYFFYFNGSLTGGFVGTSFASPVFAGSLAVAEQQIISRGGLPPNGAGKQRFGRIQDLFYSQNGRSDVWFDITSGSTGTLPDGSSATAGPGWDFCTGWGAIDFNAFVATQVSVSTPPAPANLVATAGNAQVSLTWSASSGAKSYHVKRATVSGGPYTTVASPATTSYTDTGLTNGTVYYYVVTAVNAVGESGNSNQASATPAAADTTPPTAPTGLTTTRGPNTFQITLRWTASTDPDSPNISYEVWRSSTSNGVYSRIATVSTTAFTDTLTRSGRTRWYFVVARDPAGNRSVNSAKVSGISK